MDCREARVGHHLLKHLDPVVAHDADVARCSRSIAFSRAADARGVHFHRDEVGFGWSLAITMVVSPMPERSPARADAAR